jgi:hypothetical protein
MRFDQSEIADAFSDGLNSFLVSPIWEEDAPAPYIESATVETAIEHLLELYEGPLPFSSWESHTDLRALDHSHLTAQADGGRSNYHGTATALTAISYSSLLPVTPGSRQQRVSYPFREAELSNPDTDGFALFVARRVDFDLDSTSLVPRYASPTGQEPLEIILKPRNEEFRLVFCSRIDLYGFQQALTGYQVMDNYMPYARVVAPFYFES